METTTAIQVRARPETIFRLAAAVERWPAILPHYRWVKVLREEDGGRRRTVEMAAWRDFIPLRWWAVQELLPEERRITFTHVGGPTRGMRVAWMCTPLSESETRVEIWHAFRPRWPVPDALVRRVVGEFFVGHVAGKTLRRMKELAEAECAGEPR